MTPIEFEDLIREWAGRKGYELADLVMRKPDPPPGGGCWMTVGEGPGELSESWDEFPDCFVIRVLLTPFRGGEELCFKALFSTRLFTEPGFDIEAFVVGEFDFKFDLATKEKGDG